MDIVTCYNISVMRLYNMVSLGKLHIWPWHSDFDLEAMIPRLSGQWSMFESTVSKGVSYQCPSNHGNYVEDRYINIPVDQVCPA